MAIVRHHDCYIYQMNPVKSTMVSCSDDRIVNSDVCIISIVIIINIYIVICVLCC